MLEFKILNLNYLEIYMTSLLFVATPLFSSITPMQFAYVAALLIPLLFVIILVIDSIVNDYKELHKVTKNAL